MNQEVSEIYKMVKYRSVPPLHVKDMSVFWAKCVAKITNILPMEEIPSI